MSNFLSQLTVGKSAGAFILERNGKVVAAPDPNANEAVALKTDHPLFPIAVEAIQNASAYEPGEGQPFNTKVTRDGKAYQAVLTPISFPGWSLVTVVPESEFLGPVQMTIRNLLIGLAVLIVFAGLLSAWLAQRLIAAPLIKVVNEIRHVERFDLDKVQRHPSRLTEIENLSGAIGDMAQGLAAFRKYIPADLVKRLISDGNGARLGGAVRPMSVMFIDLAGFTGMSERLGDRIIPLLSRYFDSVSAQIQNQNGTIDKFIGDAVMAFWGAPAPNPDHAVDCCRAALACRRAVEEAGLVDDHGEPRQDSHRHQFRRHAGRQYRIGSTAELHRDRRRREYCEPAGEHQQGVRLHDHHRPRNAPAGGEKHRGSRTRPAGGLWPRGRTADL